MSIFERSAGTSRKADKSPSEPRQVPWVEKYRPKNLDQVSAQGHTIAVLKRTLQSSNLPHMLFYGPPGTGKTSTVLALAKELYGPELMKSRVLELNASDERGISIVREKVKDFARQAISQPPRGSTYPCPPYKIIILDEADSMTQDAQSALRRTMETYSKITRFCLICNYVTRIIEPLASRCSKFRFKPLDSSSTVDRVRHIAETEGVLYEDGVPDALVRTGEGDMRKAITYLQSAAKLQHATPVASEDGDVEMVGTGSGGRVTVQEIEEIAGVVPVAIIASLLAACEPKGNSNGSVFSRVQKAVDDVIAEGYSANQLVLQIHDEIVKSETLSAKQKYKIVDKLGEVDKRLTEGADEGLAVLDICCNISSILATA
ncbi:Subunit of heteropentameric Replication factor C (RF-C) [Saitoella coloradoensis]